MQTGSMLQRVLLATRWLFAPVAVVFLVLVGYESRASFQQALAQARMLPLILTLVLCALLHLVTAIFSWLVLRETGAAIPYSVVLGIHVRRLPARYLPGGIWQTVSRMLDLHRIGVSRPQLSVLVLMENLIPLAVALALGGGFLYLAGDNRLPVLGAVFIGVLLLGCIPFALRHRLLLHKSGFALSHYLATLAVISLFWIIAATSFAFYWSAFPAAEVGTSFFRIFGAYLLAWAAGFAAVFAPQGIGVFESVAGLLLHGTLPWGGIALLASGFRAIVLVGDLLVYGIFLLFRYSRGQGTDGRH